MNERVETSNVNTVGVDRLVMRRQELRELMSFAKSNERAANSKMMLYWSDDPTLRALNQHHIDWYQVHAQAWATVRVALGKKLIELNDA